MVSHSRLAALGPAALAVAVSCQVVLGIEDKLDPKLGSGGAAGSGGAPPDASVGPRARCRLPPARPDGDPSPRACDRWFAAKTIFLGTHDPETSSRTRPRGNALATTSTASARRWKSRRGAISSASCKPPSGASVDSLEDGDDCRDDAADASWRWNSGDLHQFRAELPRRPAHRRNRDLRPPIGRPVRTRQSLRRRCALRQHAAQPAVREAADWTARTTSPSMYLSVDAPVPSTPAIRAPATATPARQRRHERGTTAAPSRRAPPSPFIDRPCSSSTRATFEERLGQRRTRQIPDAPAAVRLRPLDGRRRPDVTLAVRLPPKHDQRRAQQLLTEIVGTPSWKVLRPIALESPSGRPALGGLLVDGYVLPARTSALRPTLAFTPAAVTLKPRLRLDETSEAYGHGGPGPPEAARSARGRGTGRAAPAEVEQGRSRRAAPSTSNTWSATRLGTPEHGGGWRGRWRVRRRRWRAGCRT